MENDLFLPRGFLHPPTGDDADPPDASRPDWVLLDFRAYYADRRNATTATCTIMGDKVIQVTFYPARPPRVSYFCFYCSGIPHSAFDEEPKIIATDANFVLLRISIAKRNALICDGQHDYYIYQTDGASDGGPSLEPLPLPRPYFFYDEQVGLLSRGSSYAIVALRDDMSAFFLGSSGPGKFDVFLFHSENRIWTTSAVAVPLEELMKGNDEEGGFRHCTNKVITVGGKGGTMAFVDLQHGILQYDVLTGDSLLRYIALPQMNILHRGCDGNPMRYDVNPATTRDIAVVNGCFKFVEVATMMKETSGHGIKYIADGWKVTTWSMNAISSQDASWHPGHEVQSACTTVDYNSLLSNQLPVDEGNPLGHLERLIIGLPVHSMNDDVVYVMAKVERWHQEAWLISVDMTCGQLKGITELGVERSLGFRLSYTASRISQHLKISSGTPAADGGGARCVVVDD
ncbi:hypothetical protein QOZ80_3BG0262290 [Eleusine coracana subsp. coracana]|nr:hypothetical protein QOZ80_3BG0262290 [Eleusine coracana subsp. coracana]